MSCINGPQGLRRRALMAGTSLLPSKKGAPATTLSGKKNPPHLLVIDTDSNAVALQEDPKKGDPRNEGLVLGQD